MKKQRTKKYNPNKVTNKLVKAALKDSAVIFVTGGKGAHLINLKTNVHHAPSAFVAKATERLVAKWCVLCAVMLRKQNGDDYASYYLDYWDKPRTQSQIAIDAEAVHQRLLKTCNSNHLVNLGWIAVPEMYEFTEDEANEMFLKAGAWEDKAKWEQNQ